MMRTMRSVRARLVAMALVFVALLPAPGTLQALPPAAPDMADLDPALSWAGTSRAASLDLDFGRLPLYFVENRGQTDARVTYYVLGGATQVYFAADGVTFALMQPDRGGPRGRDGRGEAFLERSSAAPDPPPGATSPVAAGLYRNASPLRGRVDTPRQRWTVKLDFVGANPRAGPVGENRTAAIVSYFKGAPDQWHAGLPTYARVVYRDLWPGIDLAYYGQAGRLKYDLVVHPGADPARIRLRYRGAESVRLNAAGQMEVGTPLGGFADDAPIAWQEIDGCRAPVDVAFDLGVARATRPQPYAVTYPPSAISYPPSAIGYQPSAIGHSQSFGFSVGSYDRSQPLVIDPAVLVYCGYIGGSGDEDGRGIAVDHDSNAYVTGWTTSDQTTFPVTGGPGLTHNGGYGDAFVAKVSASSKALLYAGYIGGSGADYGYGIAVDGAGNAYVAGRTDSGEASFPVTGGPDSTFNGGTHDAFVAKVNPSGAALVYAGYIGGSGYDSAYGIAVDGAGNAYVTGPTDSDQTTFPVRVGPDLTFNSSGMTCGVLRLPCHDAFVAKVNPSGAALAYAGYIGGLSGDCGYGIAVDGAGNAYVTGDTDSDQTTFPVTGGPDLTFNSSGQNCGHAPFTYPCSDAFVARVNPSGSALVYAGYIGGSSGDHGQGIAVDRAGNAYVTGYAYSDQATFPITGGPDPTFNGGVADAFVAKVSASGGALIYAGYIGGADSDQGYGIAVDDAGNAYVTGYTHSDQATFPITGGPDPTFNGGVTDAFVAKVSASGGALIYAGYIGGSGGEGAYAIAVDAAGNAYVTGSSYSTEDSFPVAGGPDLTFNGGTYDGFVAKVSIVHWTFLPALFRPLPPPNLNPMPPPGDQRFYLVTWSAVPEADSYVLEEATDPGFTGAGQIYSGPATSHQVDSRGIQRYYYWVKAHGSTGDSSWSNTQWVDVRWEQEPNDEYTQASGLLASGATYYGLPNNGAPVSGASDHYKDYFMFDTTGGQITVGLSGLTGRIKVLQVYYKQPGARVCYITEPPYQCPPLEGGPGRYYIYIYTEGSTDIVYSVAATFP